MSIIDQLKWSLRHTRKQLLESILVVLAITLGVGVIITVLSLFVSVNEQFLQIVDGEYYRTLEIMSKVEASRRTGAPLTVIGESLERREWRASLEDVQNLQKSLPSTLNAFVETYWSAQTPLLPEEDDQEEEQFPWNRRNQISIIGTTPEYFVFKELTLRSGNVFLQSDVDEQNNVLILSDSLAQELFADQDPLGQVIPLNVSGEEEEPLYYTVIGVLEPTESDGYQGYWDGRRAYSPITSLPSLGRNRRADTSFSNVSVGIAPGVDIPKSLAQVQAEAALIWDDQVTVRSSLADYRESQQQMQRYGLLIGLFASVGLVIAIINILNLMLARVLKRTKSIGLSIALGSSRQLVFRQFILEALSLGILGSLLGIVLSFGFANILEKALGTTSFTGTSSTRIFLGLGIGFLVSLFFGVYPAYLGSKTNPVDALRTD